MFIKPYNFVLFTSHTRDLKNFSVVSVLAFILPTPGGGVVKVTKDHKKISCLMGPYGTIVSTTMLSSTPTIFLYHGPMVLGIHILLH
jgi:hypothetical protein